MQTAETAPVGDRRASALRDLDLSGKLLEFGPLDRPLVRGPKGRVFYADHFSTEDLIRKYQGDGNISGSRIVDVDFDLSKGSALALAKSSGPYDVIIASHVIEHVPDLIGWLQEVYELLRPGGVLALVVPDKRFTFDVHRRETPWWRIAKAHAEKISRPGLDTVIEHFVNVSAVDTTALWSNYDSRYETEASVSQGWSPEALIRTYNAGHYIDAHCLIVTPWRFVEIIGRIADEYSVPLALKMIEPTERNSLEFYVQLQKADGGEPGTDWAEWQSKVRRDALRPELDIE